MWGIRVLTDSAGGVTFEGTLTVLLLGAGWGAIGGAIRGLMDIGGRLPWPVRCGLFAVVCLALTLRGLNPIDSLRLLLFLPVVIAYVVVVEIVWWRVPYWRSRGDGSIAIPTGSKF